MTRRFSAFRFFHAMFAAILIVGGAGELPKAPTFFLPRGVFRSTDDVRFDVRIVTHPHQKTLRVELWELEAVPWSMLELSGDDDGVMRWERRWRVRVTEEPLERTTRAVFRFQWPRGLLRSGGHFEVAAQMVLAGFIPSHQAVHRFVVN